MTADFLARKKELNMFARSNTRNRRPTRAQRRLRRERIMGLMMIAGSLGGFALMCAAAIQADAARGMTVAQSLASWGL